MGMYKYCPTLIVQENNSTVAYEIAQMLGYNGEYDANKLLLFYKKLDMKKLILAKPHRLICQVYN